MKEMTKNIQMTAWRKVPGTDIGVSADGTCVFNTKKLKEYSVCETQGGYKLICCKPLRDAGWTSSQFVHHIVAAAFLGWRPDMDGIEVHHIDGNNSNNSADNLCLLTERGHEKIHKICRVGKKFHKKDIEEIDVL